MGDDRTVLTERIAYAESWLDRARRHIEDGDIDRGTLTLILAEAEVHRAREAGRSVSPPSPPTRSTRRLRGAGAAIAVLAAAAVLVAASVVALKDNAPVEARDVAPAPVVRLSASVGDMLRMVVAPEPVTERTIERTIERRVILRVPVPVEIPARDDRPARPVLTVPQGAAPQAPAPQVAVSTTVSAAPAPAPAVAPAAAPAPVVLNEADVIDLVLAAERSLRRSAKQ